MTPYLRPTAHQCALLVALVETGTVARAAAKLGITVYAANGQLAEARTRTGMSTVRMIYVGTRDGWIRLGNLTF